MRRLLIPIALLAAALIPPPAGAKEAPPAPDKQVLLQLTSIPDGTNSGEPWHATFSLTRASDGSGVTGLRPVVVITDLSSHAERRIPAKDVGAGKYSASVSFPEAGSYTASVERFDPRDPYRFIDWGPPIVVADTGSASGEGFPAWLLWLFGAGALALLAVAGARALRSVRAARAPLHTRGG